MKNELEKEFVPYQEALALKELGFDKPCFGYYDCERDFKFIPNKEKFLVCEIAAPTFSQAFRWFREKYEYNTEIVWMTAVNFKYSARVKSKLGTDYIDEHGTYEEAELACLRKLIEIVKQKNNK